MNEEMNIGKGKALSYSTASTNKHRRNDRVTKSLLANITVII